jgi:hypothetical protein
MRFAGGARITRAHENDKGRDVGVAPPVTREVSDDYGFFFVVSFFIVVSFFVVSMFIGFMPVSAGAAAGGAAIAGLLVSVAAFSDFEHAVIASTAATKARRFMTFS